jgi:hypothetical protein
MEPIVLRAEDYRKHVHIKLPDGFTVDEMPEPVGQQSPWGQFSLSSEQKPGELVMEEELKTEAVTLPPDQYREVKKFFDQFSGADQQQAVLVKNYMANFQFGLAPAKMLFQLWHPWFSVRLMNYLFG